VDERVLGVGARFLERLARLAHERLEGTGHAL
jgi:hypothetical protein